MNPIKAIRAFRSYRKAKAGWEGYVASKEPVMLAQAIGGAIALAAAFGLQIDMTPEQMTGLAVTIAMVAAWVARRKVTPVAKLPPPS